MVPEKTCTPRLCTHEHTNMIALTLRRYREKNQLSSVILFIFFLFPRYDITFASDSLISCTSLSLKHTMSYVFVSARRSLLN